MQGRAMRSVFPVALTAALALVAVGCGSSSTAPTTPTSALTYTTDTFSGAVNQLGLAVHPFTVTTTGPITVSLTAVAPLATMALGVGVGTWDGTNCSTAIAQNDNSRAGATALSGTVTAANYCLRVYDPGNIPDGWTVTYTIQVVHP